MNLIGINIKHGVLGVGRVWATYVIQKMLKNEKYKGCTIFQKTFTEDYLTGKRKVNYGERVKYYVEDTLPAPAEFKLLRIKSLKCGGLYCRWFRYYNSKLSCNCSATINFTVDKS